MAFPSSPTDGQQHTEGGTTFSYVLAENAWIIVGGSGGANLSIGSHGATTLDVVSDSGTDATIPAATASLAGLLTAADKTKLDGIETGATADQSAAEVAVTPAGNLGASNTQAALEELQGDIDALQSVTGNFVGQVSTSAALDALVDVDGTTAVENGDIAFLDTDDAGREAGFYLRTGGAWPAAPFFQVPDTFVAGVANTSDNLAGDGGASQLYARADHRHAQSRGIALPATDGTAGAEHILQGHGSLPDGKYVLITDAGAANKWVQVG